MTRSKAAPWALGTAFLAAIVLALAWMLLVSPQLAAASTARDDAEAARAVNVVQQHKLTTLKTQFAHLDEYRAELAGLRKQIPEADDLAALIREIDAASAASGAFVVSVDAGVPEVFLSAAAAAAATSAPAAPSDGGTDTGSATGDAASTDGAATTAEATPAGVNGMYAIPLTMTVLGTYPATVDFVDRTQEAFQRLFVVTQFTIAGQKQQEASGGRPATAEGDAEFTVQGYVYVLQDASSTDGAAPDAPAGTEAAGTTDN